MSIRVGRRTAVVELFHSADGPLPLDRDRRYDTALRIDGVSIPCQRFASPLGDEAWRETIATLRACTASEILPSRRREEEVADAGNRLLQALRSLAPALADFLAEKGPRRLVIASARPEVHALPWEALADDALNSLATSDLSIVRSRTFSTDARRSPQFLGIHSTFGPDTTREVLAAAESVQVAEVDGRPVGLDTNAGDDAAIVNIVAHGDQYDGLTQLSDDRLVDAKQLADQYRDRLMVLVWSCFSGMVHSWGDSPAMALHDANNAVVLGFIAPLRFKMSAAVATRFYQSVFGPAGSQDPEQAITEIRQWQFAEDREFCDWASMTLWLRQPVDLSAVPLGTVQLPKDRWAADAVSSPDALREVLDRAAAPGDAHLVQSVDLRPPVRTDLVQTWRGPVVLLDRVESLKDDQLFAALDIDVSGVAHPAERFLLLLDRLETYRYALLVWINVSAAEVLLLDTVDRIPPNVAIVLTSPFEVQQLWQAGRVSVHNGGKGPAESQPAGDGEFVRRVLREEFAEAVALGVPAALANDDEAWSCMYLAAVRTRRLDLAADAISRLRAFGADLEADLLQGNLEGRSGNHQRARELYRSVLDRARQTHVDREAARAEHELAYVVNEMGDRGLADQLYRSAIAGLERLDPAKRNSLWHSALARALRDYADMLAESGDEAALPLLRRGAAIHALERRPSQVAYCEITRSRLMTQLGRYDAAEAAAQQAAIVFDQKRNDDGWVDAMRLAAKAACGVGRYAEARAILERAVKRQSLAQKPALVGRLQLALGEAALAMGAIDVAGAAAASARGQLPAGLRRDRVAAERLAAFTATLVG